MSTTSTDRRRPVPAIDPRIRARRIAVRRDEGRHRLRRLGALAAVVALGAAATGLALSPALDVDHVRVVGAVRTGPGAVAAASGVRPGDALVTLDASAAGSAVATLPWVRSATVRRAWPGTVEIEVVERTAVAGFVRLDGQVLLADADGRLLELVGAGGQPDAELGLSPRPAGEAEAGAPALPLPVHGLGDVGDPGESARRAHGGVAQAALDLATALPPEVVRATERIDAGGDVLTLVLRRPDGGTARVLVGDGDPRAKAIALATLVAQADLADVEVIDVRVPATPTLTRE